MQVEEGGKKYKKMELLKAGARPNPFIDPEGYRRYIATAEKVYLEQLKP